MKKLLNKIIGNLGKSNYILDSKLTGFDIYKIVLRKTFQIVRGLRIKLQVNGSRGIIFADKRVRIYHGNKLSLGKTITFGENVEINALSKSGVTIGNNVTIGKNTIIECTGVLRNLGEGLIIGNNVGISQNCFIQVRGMVQIGSDVIFGPGVFLFSENHNFNNTDELLTAQGEIRTGVKIENNVWVGAGSIILDGVKIGTGSIIGAGSVITKNVAPFSIMGGVPGKLIRCRIDAK
jgi:acetyltransferase-like isoleucine patch superfamily enzyme